VDPKSLQRRVEAHNDLLFTVCTGISFRTGIITLLLSSPLLLLFALSLPLLYLLYLR
jgi:hypothetical protein